MFLKRVTFVCFYLSLSSARSSVRSSSASTITSLRATCVPSQRSARVMLSKMKTLFMGNYLFIIVMYVFIINDKSKKERETDLLILAVGLLSNVLGLLQLDLLQLHLLLILQGPVLNDLHSSDRERERVWVLL